MLLAEGIFNFWESIMYCYRRSIATLAITCLLLSSCVPPNKANTYAAGETGQDAVILYGIIKSSRPVEVTGTNTGTGALVGAAAGGGAGSAIGSGNGTIGAVIAGVIIGGIAGAAAEQAMKDQQGIEYIIKFSETGDTRSIVQTVPKADMPIANGQCVMVQMSGQYQRVMPNADPADCPAPSKRKTKRTKTKIKGSGSETTIDRE
jgi:outer membrane lipoprotein SlyB